MAIPKWQDVGVSFAGSTGSMANARRGIADAARLAYGISDRIQKQADTEAALERQKVLQGREDALWNRQQQEQQAMDIYNKNQTPQQLAAATLAVEQDKGARDRVDALSFTPEELKLIEGETYVDEHGLKRSKNTYKDEADLERSLLAREVDPLTARAIRDKAQLQRTLGEEVNKVAPTYESEIMARQRAYEQAVKAGGGVVPAAMAADLRSARAADEQVRISKREALEKQLESVDRELSKLELAAIKEGVRVDEKSGGGSSGKSKTLMGSPEVGIEKFADELKKEVSNFKIGMDATKVKTAVAKMKALGFSEDEQKYVLNNLVREGLLETYVMDPTDEQIVELGRAYDNAVAKGGGGNTAYVRALQGDVANWQSMKKSLMNQLKAVDADPMAARIANARAAILGVGEVPKVAPTRVETSAPKTEVRKPSGTRADIFEQMTPAQQAEAEKQSLITGTRGQFDALHNKPNKTEEDWKTLEELGKELDVLTGRVSGYVPVRQVEMPKAFGAGRAAVAETGSDNRPTKYRQEIGKVRADAADAEVAAVLGVSPYEVDRQELSARFGDYLSKTGGKFGSKELEDAYRMYSAPVAGNYTTPPAAPSMDGRVSQTRQPLPENAPPAQRLGRVLETSGIKGMGIGNEVSDIANRLKQGVSSMVGTLVDTAMLPADAINWYYGTDIGKSVDPLRERLQEVTRGALAKRGVVGADADRALIAQSLLAPSVLGGAAKVLKTPAGVGITKADAALLPGRSAAAKASADRAQAAAADRLRNTADYQQAFRQAQTDYDLVLRGKTNTKRYKELAQEAKAAGTNVKDYVDKQFRLLLE